MRIAVVIAALTLACLSAPGQVIPGSSAPAAAPAAPTTDKGVVLDETGYFRFYYKFGLMRISAEAIKSEGDKLLGKDVLKRLETDTKKHLRDRKLDWNAVNWQDVACVHFCRTQLGDDTRAAELIQTVAPPAEWAGLGFDDATWMRQRLGKLPRNRYMKEAYEFTPLLIRSACLRTYFNVADPSAARDLTLSLTYRGGVRVLVNGAEVARGHLAETPKETPGTGTNFAKDAKLVPVPTAKLEPVPTEAAAIPYSREAYVAMDDEVPKGKGGIISDIRCTFDEAGPAKDAFHQTACRATINRKGWDRLLALRDRKLGPVTIPAGLLKKGANVLAIEVVGAQFHPQILPGAGGDNWAIGGGTDNYTWDHARLLGIQMRCPSGAVQPCTVRPAGVQVWAEDMHTRLFSEDFNPPGWPSGKVSIVGATNGTFGGMVVVGADKELPGLKAAVGELTGQGGAKIPASAVTVSYLKGHGINQLYQLGDERCLGMYSWDVPMARIATSRYQVKLNVAEPADGDARSRAWAQRLGQFQFFDHISPAGPAAVPANTIQPIWLSIKLPADAKAGKYAGNVTISAEGMPPATVPVELEVIGWRVPNASEFQTIVESEQSPYGLAKHYAPKQETPGTGTNFAKDAKLVPVPTASFLWSDAHWKLMDSSFAQLARLGADWVFVPVLANSEFGNRADCSMIKWTRKADGSLGFDYAIMDKYLDLAVKHLGVPKVITVQIMHGCPSSTNAVNVFDEASGKYEMLDVGPTAGDKRRAVWRAFATSVVEHMRQKGWAGSLYWGHAFDNVTDPGLVAMMQEFAPGVYWSAGAHARQPDSTFRAVARAYGSDIIDHSLLGWKNPFIHLVMPRTNGSVICVEGTSTPFSYRVLSDRAIYCGFNGVGRMGADYFDVSWFDGFQGGQYLLVGRSCVQTLWPGETGIDSSTRNEAMLEGVQEAEARIFLEQALDHNLLNEPLAAEVRKTLDEHFRSTLHIPGGTSAITMMEYTGPWREQSRRLFQAAAKAANAIGVDVDKSQIGGEKITVVFGGETRTGQGRAGVPLPALGKASTELRIRNWTGQSRNWKAATTQPWIKPAKAEGSLAGQELLPITLDGTDLKAGQVVTGTLTITDVASGRNFPVQIAAAIEKAFELKVEKNTFNPTIGQADSRDYLLLNRTSGEQDWKITSSSAWMSVEPASGKLPAGGSTFVKVTAAPPDKAAAVYDTTLTLSAAKGAVTEELTFKTFAIPAYQAPSLPAGTPAGLETVSKELLVKHRSVNWFNAREIHTAPTFAKELVVWHGPKPAIIGDKKYDLALWVLPYHETVYKLEGKGYSGFSAEVGWNAMVHKSEYAAGWTGMAINFEVWVDGKPRAMSGLMKANEGPRLLAVEGLENAKELKLISRTDYAGDCYFGYCCWGTPRLYKK